MKLTPEQLSLFLFSISLMLFSARLLGEFFEKLKQPPVIGEILAGIILGPTILGALAPQFHSWIFPRLPELELVMDGMTSLAVIMLMLVLGLEVDLSLIIRNTRTAFFTSLMGMVFPFIIGFGSAYLFPEFLGIQDRDLRLVFALFMGTAMSISALPVIARTLMDLDIYKTEIGLIIIASAMFGDLAGWIIFSIILGMIGVGEHGLSFTEKIAFIFLFMAFMLFLGRKIINKIFPYLQTKLAFPGGVLNFIFVLGFLGAALTEMIGIHAIFGAFITGIAIGDSVHLREKTREMIQQVVTNIFAPLFFVSIGLRVDFIAHFDFMLVAIIILIAFFGKVAGSGLGAYWGGLNKNDSLAIGFGMNSRGAMEIILGLLALQSGLIHERVFVALVIMAFLTSLTSGPLMSLFLRYRKKLTLKELVTPGVIIFSHASDKQSMIAELVNLVCKKYNLTYNEIFSEVWKREEQLATGMANYLAVPHAAVNIDSPLIAVGINQNGIAFEAADRLPAKIILLLLTPKDQSELQLQLLSEIATRFKERKTVEEILKSKTPEEFCQRLNQITQNE